MKQTQTGVSKMVQVQQSTIVVGILAKVQAHITGRLPRGKYKVPTSDTLLAVAKDLGFIEGRRGRAGGFEATDLGLEFAGMDVEEFRTKAALDHMQDQAERAEQSRKTREKRQQELQNSLQAALEKAVDENEKRA